MPTHRLRSTYLLALAALATPTSRGAAQALGEGATQAMVAYYEKAEHWALRGIVILGLGRTWHPVGNAMILSSLRGKDKRLKAFGIEALRRLDPALVPSTATPELLDELIGKQLQNKNKLYRTRVLEVLSLAAPDAGAKTPTQWKSWWRKQKKEWRAAEWSGQAQVDADRKKGGTTSGFVERAFDLNAAGLEVAIVIDTTGSMQPTIDTARDALVEIVTMLRGISPKFRIGLVHYRDFEDFNNGAKLLVPLTANVKQVQGKLARMVAAGGGDAPERVEKGLEIAYSREMRWQKNANKVVLVIGDAPPHSEKIDYCAELAKNAFEKPFANPKSPTTGPSKKLRPFVTSAISIGGAPEKWFKQISKAGGGSHGRLDIGGDARDDAVSKIVEHILALSYGAQWEKQMRDFVRVLQAYRRAGFVKMR